MERFIGLDVHMQTCTFAVMNQKGETIRTDVVETNGKVLVEYLRLIPGRKHLCLEEGTQSQWLSEILSPHVHELAVIWPEKKPGNKNDKLDAVGLAERMRTGSVGKKTYKAPKEFTVIRQLARCYNMITSDVVRTKNRIKSFYRARGIVLERGRCDSAVEQEVKEVGTGLAVQMLSEHLKRQEDIKACVQQELLKESHKHKISGVLETVPGFGPVRASLLLAEVITPHRFRTSRQYWSYCGLGIVMRSSSDWVQKANGEWVRSPIARVRGLNRNHSRVAKNLFKAAATTVISQMRTDPLHQDYHRLLESGTKPNLAKLTIARKIAALNLAMWKREEQYNPEKYRRNGT